MGYTALQIGIADGLLAIGYRTVIDDGRTHAMPGLYMTIYRIITAIYLAAGKPFVKRRLAIIQHFLRLIQCTSFAILDQNPAGSANAAALISLK